MSVMPFTIKLNDIFVLVKSKQTHRNECKLENQKKEEETKKKKKLYIESKYLLIIYAAIHTRAQIHAWKVHIDGRASYH